MILTPSHQEQSWWLSIYEEKGRIMSSTTNIIIITIAVSVVVILFYWGLKVSLTKAAISLGWKPRVKKYQSENEQKQERSIESKQKEHNLASGILNVLIVGGILWFFFSGGLEKQAAKNMRRIQNQVAADSVAQYGIAHRNGTAMDRCVQAGMVTAAFLLAQDESNYQQWKTIEKNDCRSAGLYH